MLHFKYYCSFQMARISCRVLNGVLRGLNYIYLTTSSCSISSFEQYVKIATQSFQQSPLKSSLSHENRSNLKNLLNTLRAVFGCCNLGLYFTSPCLNKTESYVHLLVTINALIAQLFVPSTSTQSGSSKHASFQAFNLLKIMLSLPADHL